MITKDAEIFAEYKNQYLQEKIAELKDKIQDLECQRREYAYKIGCKQAEIEICEAKHLNPIRKIQELEEMLLKFNQFSEECNEEIEECIKERDLYRTLIK